MTELKKWSHPKASSFARVLIVDDEDSNLGLIGALLKRNGYKFLMATNGEEAIAAAQDASPALILLDVMMPVMDGMQTCLKLKADPKTADIPIVFLTAKAEKESLVEGFAVGGVDYITKPFSSEELLARVQTHLELHRVRRELEEMCDLKSNLLTTLAHDVKNPSGAIYSLTRLILDDLGTENFKIDEVQSLLELIDETAFKMHNHVGEILDESRRVETGDSIHHRSLVDVRKLVDHLVLLNQVQAKAKGIAICVEGTFAPEVKIGQRLLTEMFDNLLSNAVKFSKRNAKVSVRLLDLGTEEGHFRFEVIDEAPPLSAEDAEKIFAPFQKGVARPVGEGTSHGVGLGIVSRLVQLFNGEAGACAREDGSGNCFFVELPLSDPNTDSETNM